MARDTAMPRSHCSDSTGPRARPRFLLFAFLGTSTSHGDAQHSRYSDGSSRAIQPARLIRELPSSRSTPRRAKSHRGGAWGAGRQDRVEPADERDAGGDGAGAVPELVRGFRPRPRQTRWPHAPGLDPATAALFPAHFQDSHIGHIPQGWTVEPVGDVVDCVGGGTPSTAEPKYWEGGTHHWTTPKDFSSLRAPILLDTDRKLTDAGIAKISSGLLPVGTLLLSSRAPVGYLALAAMPVAINQGFIALKCNERASNFFMLNWCQANMAEIESRATGTTFAEISKQNFRPILVVLPPKELMAAFTAKVAPFYAQITANLHQSRTLATLRDTLLPKLLSGELQPDGFDTSRVPVQQSST